MVSISLADVLKCHSVYEGKTELSLSLADGFLYETNPYYRNLRNSSIQLNTNYTTNNIYHHRAINGPTLFEILKSKSIVYIDNVSPLRQIEAARPNRFSFQDIGFVGNYVHHETTHLIADQILSKSVFQKIKHPDAEQKEALRIEFAEALASTNDLIGAYGSKSEMEILLYHSATRWRPLRSVEFDRVVQTIGFTKAYQFIFVGFLCRYMLYRKIDELLFSQIVSLLFGSRRFSKTELKALVSLLKIPFRVPIESEIDISNFYFRLVFENDRDVFDLLNWDFFQLLIEYPILLERVGQMADLVESGPVRSAQRAA